MLWIQSCSILKYTMPPEKSIHSFYKFVLNLFNNYADALIVVFVGCGLLHTTFWLFLLIVKVNGRLFSVLSNIISCSDGVISLNCCWYFFFFYCIVSREKNGIELYQIIMQELNFLEIFYSLSLVSFSLLIGWFLIKQVLCVLTSLGRTWKLTVMLHGGCKQQVYDTVWRSQSPLMFNFQNFGGEWNWGEVSSIVPGTLNLNRVYCKILFSILLRPWA